MAVDYKVKHYIDPEKLKADLRFSDHDLTSALMTQSGMFSYYATMHARAEKQLDDLELLMEITRSKVDKEIRDRADAAEEKMTEKKIDAEIGRDGRVISMKRKINEAKMIAGLAKNALEAWKQRRDMLIQVGVSIREELKGSPTVKGEAWKERQRQVMEKINPD